MDSLKKVEEFWKTPMQLVSIMDLKLLVFEKGQTFEGWQIRPFGG